MTSPPHPPPNNAPGGSFRRSYVHALASSDLSATERSVARALAEFADWSTGGRCWPSGATLASWVGVTPRSVTRALHALERAGWIVGVRAPGRTTSYQLQIALTPDTVSPLTQCHPRQDVRGTPDTVSGDPRQDVRGPLTGCQGTPDTVSYDLSGSIIDHPSTCLTAHDGDEVAGGLRPEPLNLRVDIVARCEQLIADAQLDAQGRPVRLVLTSLIAKPRARGVDDDDIAAVVAMTLADVKIVRMHREGARWGYWVKSLKGALDAMHATEATAPRVDPEAIPRELRKLHPDHPCYLDPDIKTYGDLDRANALAPQPGSCEFDALMARFARALTATNPINSYDADTGKRIKA